MLCSNCLDSQAQGKGRAVAPAYHPDPEQWETVLCAGCGMVIVHESHSEALLTEKLSQLSRFGLADGGRPLLGSSGSEDF